MKYDASELTTPCRAPQNAVIFYRTSAVEYLLGGSTRVNTIAIKLDPARLTNPDVDMRYTLPDLLAERSGGVIRDDGYDYVGPSNAMVLFLAVSDLARATACITDVIANVRVLENDLRSAATVAIQRGDRFEVIFPADSREEFSV